MSNPYKKPTKDWLVYESCLGLHEDYIRGLLGCFCSRRTIANDEVDSFIKDYIYEIFVNKGTDDRYKNHCFFIFKKQYFESCDITICFLHECKCKDKAGIYLGTKYFDYLKRIKSMKVFL